MTRYYIGIDNGVTGSIGVIGPDGSASLWPVPTKVQQSYVRRVAQVTRIDYPALVDRMNQIERCMEAGSTFRAFLERPFTGGPATHAATVSAMRCLESWLIALELLLWPYEYVDSRQWQGEMLPSGLAGSAQLKKASREVGWRLWPDLATEISKQKDADALLIAEWARRGNR